MTSPTADIKRLLNERRPDRYTAGDGDVDWMMELAAETASSISPASAQQRAALALIKQHERSLIKETNSIIRSCLDGRPPLDWLFFRDMPLAVGKERIAVRAATPEDFRRFEREERKRAAHDFTQREKTCQAASQIADYMEAQGFRSGAELTW